MDYTDLANGLSFKRSYSMAQTGAAPPFLNDSGASRAPHDDHYNNYEHRPQRRRMEQPWHRQPQNHFPGDGLDFRRPVMTAASAADTVDLTDDGHEQTSPPRPRLALPDAPDAVTASASTSRAQRLPRFQRDIIDLADSDEEQQQQQQQQEPAHWPAQQQHIPRNFRMEMDHFLPRMEADDDSLFLPEAPTRPTTAGLRRLGYPPRPNPAMDLDDVEIVSSRPLSRNPSRRATPAVFMPGQNAAHGPPNNENTTIDLTADDDDEVIHTDTRPLPSINGDRPAMAGSGIGTRDRPPVGGDFGIGRLVQSFRGANYDPYAVGRAERDAADLFNRDAASQTRLVQRFARQRHADARARRMALEERQGRQGDAGRHHGRRPRAAAMPQLFMDYEEVGFNMFAEPVQPATPTYEPPPPVEKGFTRSPTEDEEVVCPNCGDELAVGKGELKQQVWVVKSCGHAYCGECATRTRTSAASRKGKGKATDPIIPPPLKKCVVVGCEKSATKRDMIHIYMSS